MAYNQYAENTAAYPPPTAPGFAPDLGGYQQAPPPNVGYAPGYPPPQGEYPPQGPPGYPPTGYPPVPQGPPVTQPPIPYGPPPQQNVPMVPVPQALPGVPPGLEYLTAVDQLIMKQKAELLEAFIGFETNNKYSIKNSMGQKIFDASEKTDCCTRNICGPLRPFNMKIKDLRGVEVIHLYRPLRCTSCCFPCFLQKLEVCAPPGVIIGYVYQEWSILGPEFTIRDPQETILLRIKGPFCTMSCCGDVNFEVLSETTRENVGRISKQWSGLLREAFTDSDNFGISFPIDLHVNVKACLLAATFLIDFMFFESAGDKHDRPGMLD